MKRFIGFLKVFTIVVLTSTLVILTYVAYNMYTGFKETAGDVTVIDREFHGEKASEKGKVNILIVGSDARDKNELGRADTLMVAQYDREKKAAKIVSIMRDSYVDIPGYWPDKINSAYSYGGPELMRETLKDNFDLPIEYYATITFPNFTDLINALFSDGIEIDAEKDLKVDDDEIKKGLQKMDGHTLLQYVRFRKDDESDFGRIRRQNQAMEEIARQAQDLTTIARLPKVLGMALGYLDTNLNAKVLTSIGSDFILGKTKALEHLSIPVENSWSFDDYTEAGSVIRLDLLENTEQLKTFLGE